MAPCRIDKTDNPGPGPVEPATNGSRWARVLSDSDWREPLRELAAAYSYCVYAWWRRAGLGAPKAATATVAAFTRWLTDARPLRDEPGAERMREWLPKQLAELATQGVKLTSPAAIEIDPVSAEARYAEEPPGGHDAIFQRRWALTVLDFAVTTLRAEHAARGEGAFFSELLAFAGYEASEEDRYAAAAARAGLTSGAMRKAVFDFRKRQRELLLSFVGDTVLDAMDAGSELTALLCAVSADTVFLAPDAGAEPGPATAGPADSAAGSLPAVLRGVRPDEMLARAMQSVRMTGAGAHGWEPPTVEEAARLFPQYEIISLLGRGGMGAVYKGRQPALDRFVAIKLLPLEVSADGDFADRFRREARAMAKLLHPNIIAVFEFGTTAEGHLYIVMEFVEGANLHQMIHGPGITPAQALEIISGVCDALAYAHGKGVVHRDIKPANVMVSVEGDVKVADFGLARLIDSGAEQMGHTMTGTVMGTPDYMAPEQSRGMNVDHRADIYSLGVMLYEMLCREVPKGIFDPPSARVAVDGRVDQVVIKAMQQQPDRRYQSTKEMKTDVSAARTPLPVPAPAAAAAAAPPAPLKRPAPPGPPRPPGPPKPDGVAEPAPPPQVPEVAAAEAIPLVAPAKSKTPIYIGLAAVLVIAAVAFFLFRPKPKSEQSSKAQTDAAQNATEQSVSGPTATKDAPFVNTLGMKFVPVPGTKVLFSIWDTRVQDYAAYAGANKVDDSWTRQEKDGVPIGRELNHPVVGVDWEDAQAFCKWLTEKEIVEGKLPKGAKYRLPTDEEWSWAVGLRPELGTTPEEKNEKNSVDFPWGKEWPPRGEVGNYADEAFHEKFPLNNENAKDDWNKNQWIEGYNDGYATTSPVGSFPANAYGLYDMGGNVCQWCEDWMDKDQRERVSRGASWFDGDHGKLVSSIRHRHLPTYRNYYFGFRCVLEPAPSAESAATIPATATKDAPFANTLGMQFVPVSGTKVLFSVWDTRVQDYAAYAGANKVDDSWTRQKKDGVPVGQELNHPVAEVSWDDAQAFCKWLTGKEIAEGKLPKGAKYRLPTDEEWSWAVGLPPELGATLAEKLWKNNVDFPWGKEWPPRQKVGNYADEAFHAKFPLNESAKEDWNKNRWIEGYSDGYATTSPVGSFPANAYGLYDMGGNVWQWCGDWFDASHKDRVFRGASWGDYLRGNLLSSFRNHGPPTDRRGTLGFRCVLELAPSAVPTVTTAAEDPALLQARTPSTAAKDAPFVNTLGMKFVPVPGTKVLFGIWDTRVQDYAAYARVKKVDDSWTKQQRDDVPVSREPEYPVVGVSWEDAQAFCKWLTEKEIAEGKLPKGVKYRLPTDEEWSWAVGLPPESGETPADKNGKNSVDFPWGKEWPPRGKVGNYADEAYHVKFPSKKDEKTNRMDNPWIEGYSDGYATTSPVGSFPANAYGLSDMGGNVWQWCEDWFDDSHKDRVFRGASWYGDGRGTLLSSYRGHSPSSDRYYVYGFRCVVDASASPATAPAQALSHTSAAATKDTPASPAAAPAQNLSATPVASVAPTSQLPPGKWVKVFTKFEELPADRRKPDGGAKWEDGWIKATSPRGFALLPYYNRVFRNAGIRAVVRTPSPSRTWGSVVFMLRISDDSSYSSYQLLQEPNAAILSFWRDGWSESMRERIAASTQRNVPANDTDAHYEFGVVGARLVGRVNDELAVGKDQRLQAGHMGFHIRSWVRDIEVINLDGLPEAEALRILGVDENGHDLRGKTSATPARP